MLPALRRSQSARRCGEAPACMTKLGGQQTRHHVHMHPIEHDGFGELRVGLHGEVKVRVVKSKSSAQVAELRLVQDGMHVLQAKQHHAKSRDSKRFEFIKIDIGAADVVGGVTGFHEIPTQH